MIHLLVGGCKHGNSFSLYKSTVSRPSNLLIGMTTKFADKNNNNNKTQMTAFFVWKTSIHQEWQKILMQVQTSITKTIKKCRDVCNF